MNRQRLSIPFLVATALLWPTNAARAEYMPADLEKIPVEQLVKTLEMLADRNPKDATIRLNLARAHAMAYALKTDTLQALKKRKPEAGAWLGYEPPHIPFRPKMTKEADKQRAALTQLNKAIQRYEETVKLAPDNLTAQLGLAWCMEQAGKKDDAVRAYRRVIENAWMKEKDLKTAGLGWHSATAEAARYLTPMLDKEKDANEIKELAARVKQMEKVRRPITPLVIPLRPGLSVGDLVDLRASVAFDADGSGLKHKWTWITKDAGWLVYDRQKSGKVDSALQLFGNVTFWMFWENGYRALNVLDKDQDGWLTGVELNGLAVWVDANGNGVVDPGELKSLSELGIVSLSCQGQTTPTLKHTAAHAPVGVRFRDGTTRPTFDVLLYLCK